MKLLFIPISVVGGILAGFIAKKVFEQAWGLIDDEEPPEAEHREIDYRKLAAALVLEGASGSSGDSSTTARATVSSGSPARGRATRPPSPSSPSAGSGSGSTQGGSDSALCERIANGGAGMHA